MNAVANWIGRLGGLDLERRFGLHAPCAPVCLQVDRTSIALVRVRPHGRGRPRLEALEVLPLEPGIVPASIFHAAPPSLAELAARVRLLFERSGTKPTRVSLVIPDNLAKITLLTLPERPASPRQLDEIVRAQLRRGLPFKLDEARTSYHVLPTGTSRLSVLAVATRKSTVEQLERACSAAGVRVGLVDLSTPNLINLCRPVIDAPTPDAGDVALLNGDDNYFSLAILRDGQLIFLRCKTYALGSEGHSGPNGMLLREVANSISYYQEKLAGRGVGTLFVRSVGRPVAELAAQLESLGIARIAPIAPAGRLEIPAATPLTAELGQQLAPAIGAVTGRGR